MFLSTKLWHLFRIFKDYRAGKDTVHNMPIRLWIDTSSRCNLRCVMCPNKDLSGDEKGLMSLELFKKIVDEAKHFVHDVYLHHRGEPLLNPALFDMIRYARANNVRTRFHTNGTLLDEDKARRLLDAGPDLVSFSIDGFEKQAYEKVRIGAKFENTVENVLRLLEMRGASGIKRPYIVIEKIKFHGQEEDAETHARAEDLRNRFLSAGADEIIEKEEYEWADDCASEHDEIRSYSKCTFVWYSMVISWDGAVSPCPQDFSVKMNMGNASESSLAEIWNSKAYRELRNQMMSDIGSLPLCRKCDRLSRKTVGGVPFQYMIAFLADQVVGYSKLRKLLGTAERN